MSRELQTTAEIVDALGGTGAVARLTGAKSTAVSNWKARKSFPSSTFVIIKSALAIRGCTAPDQLWKMAQVEPVQ